MLERQALSYTWLSGQGRGPRVGSESQPQVLLSWSRAAASKGVCYGLSSAGMCTKPESKHIFTFSLKCSEEQSFSEITHFWSIMLYLSMQNNEVEFSFFIVSRTTRNSFGRLGATGLGAHVDHVTCSDKCLLNGDGGCPLTLLTGPSGTSLGGWSSSNLRQSLGSLPLCAGRTVWGTGASTWV